MASTADPIQPNGHNHDNANGLDTSYLDIGKVNEPAKDKNARSNDAVDYIVKLGANGLYNPSAPFVSQECAPIDKSTADIEPTECFAPDSIYECDDPAAALEKKNGIETTYKNATVRNWRRMTLTWKILQFQRLLSKNLRKWLKSSVRAEWLP